MGNCVNKEEDMTPQQRQRHTLTFLAPKMPNSSDDRNNSNQSLQPMGNNLSVPGANGTSSGNTLDPNNIGGSGGTGDLQLPAGKRMMVHGSFLGEMITFTDKKIIGPTGKFIDYKELNSMGISISCKKGLKPESPNQDDFFIVVDTEFKIYCVCDGHGANGHYVANYVTEHLPSILTDSAEWQKGDYEEALRKGFLEVNERMNHFCETTQPEWDCHMSGCTCTVVVHLPDKLVMASCGDSRAVLGRKKKGKLCFMDLTQDDKPTLPKEKERIEANGGEVRRLEGDFPHRVFQKGELFPGLAMSRALGDLSAAEIGVIAEPTTRTYNIDAEQDLFVLVCSDGVWEFMKSREAIETIKKQGLSKVHKATETLAQNAKNQWLLNELSVVDDITCLAAYLQD